MNRLIFAVFASFMLLLSACVEGTPTVSALSGGSVKGKTAAEIALEKETKSLSQVSKEIVTRNTVQGVIVGAVAGCVMAELFGGDCAQGAVAGGIVGGVGGNAAGRKAAAANKQLVNQRQVIANLTGINKRLGSIQSNLRRVVASQNSEISSLRRRLASNQVSKAQYSSRVRAINSNRSAISSSLQRAENNVARSQQTLVNLGRQDGRSYSTERRAVTSTQNRLARLRKSASLARVN
ncbi:hypothetical protein [Profundibacter sp.]